MSGEESKKWFQEVVPVLANLLLRLPSLLETHYKNPNNAMLTTTALRLLDTQKPGIIFLSQVTFLNVTLDCHMRACMLEMVNIVNFYCQRSYGMMHDFNMHSCMMKMVMVNIISPISGFSGVDCCSSLLLIILCIPSQRQTCEAFSEEDQL